MSLKTNTPKIGVSSCLMGYKVRYDGRGKAVSIIQSTLEPQFTLVAFCPEHGAGLGVPRSPMQLYGKPESLQLLVVESKENLGNILDAYISQIIDEIKRQTICGFILKSKSPSCGLLTTPLYNLDDTATGSLINGVFAERLTKEMPDLPLIDELDFQNSQLRQGFIRRVLNFYHSN